MKATYFWSNRNKELFKHKQPLPPLPTNHKSITYFSYGSPVQLGSRFLEVPVDLSWWSPQSLVP